jgi:hypothetical protein
MAPSPEIFGGEILVGSGKKAGRLNVGGDVEVSWRGGAKSELSKEQVILRTLQR